MEDDAVERSATLRAGFATTRGREEDGVGPDLGQPLGRQLGPAGDPNHLEPWPSGEARAERVIARVRSCDDDSAGHQSMSLTPFAAALGTIAGGREQLLGEALLRGMDLGRQPAQRRTLARRPDQRGASIAVPRPRPASAGST